MKKYVYQVFMIHGRGDYYQTDIDCGLFTNLPMAKEYIKMAVAGSTYELSVEDFDVYRHNLNVMFRRSEQPEKTLVRVSWE